MRMIITLLFIVSGYALAAAQDTTDRNTTLGVQPNVENNDVNSSLYPTTYAVQPAEMMSYGEDLDSLNLPTINQYGQVMPTTAYPSRWWGWNDWRLHKGLNVSLDMSVFASFGKGAYHGAGFSQNISAIYAMPLTDKLSLAVGGYFGNMTWGGSNYRDAGLSAVLGYRFDEHWEAYVYAQKSLVNNYNMPRPLYDINAIGDRIGAAVKYNFSPSFSLGVSVESYNLPAQRVPYFPNR